MIARFSAEFLTMSLLNAGQTHLRCADLLGRSFPQFLQPNTSSWCCQYLSSGTTLHLPLSPEALLADKPTLRMR
jgi:hypothetical protein